MSMSALPTVIIPVHNALSDLRACLKSLQSSMPAEAEVLLIDDASDDVDVKPFLRQWLGQVGPTWRVEFESVNQGFVATVNRGMSMTEGDIVLLNSDTLLTPGWLQGIQRCLDSDKQIATATPWSNNGEIVSLPHFCQANPVPPDVDAIAEIISQNQSPVYPDIPTAVGFCMGVSRFAIENMGFFDHDLFGLGYGEENDFSMRASENGMRNVLCDDVFVAHVGGRSFKPKGLKPDESSMRKLLSKHPTYLELVQKFIAADPLADRRQNILSAVESSGIQWTQPSTGIKMEEEGR